MRKTVISTLFLFAVALQAATYSSTLSEARAVQMENYKEKESAIFERVESIIMRTSNFAITRADIQQAWSLPYTYWNNFEKEPCTVAGDYCVGNTGAGINLIIDPLNKQISLENSLGASPNEENIRLYSKDRTDEVIVDALNSAIKPFSVALSNMYELYTQIIANPLNEISTTPPTDTSKTWYKPNGYGGYDIYSFIDGAWKKVGLADSDGKSEIFAATEAELLAIPCTLGTKGYVGDGTSATQYVCGLDGTWELLSSGSTAGGTFTGSATLKEVACDIFSKDGGSIAEVSPAVDQYLSLSTTVEFIKFDNITTGGYWKQNSPTPAFVVFKDIAGAIAHKSAFSTGTKAYICKNGSDVYEMQKTAFNRWAYIGYNFNKTATFFQNAPLDDGGYILSWDTVSARSDAHKKYFQAVGSGTTLHYASKYNFNNTIVNTSDITQNIKLSPASRTNFGTGAYNTWYLSANDDCPTKLNCNGATTATYAGTSPSTYDGMYSWYYSPLGIIDAQPFSTLALAYASTANPQAVIVGSNVYTRGLDSNSKECYKNVSNNVFYTGGTVAFPTVMVVSGVVQMPTTKTCETATFTSGTYLNLGSWVEVTDWTSAPIYARTVAGGKYWQKKATGVSGRWLSTDNLVQMTKGSRTNLANPNGTTLTNITRVVGTEPRYTPSGVTYTANTSFLQWFYSTTGTITNNMLDRVAAGSQTFTASGTFTTPLGWDKVAVCLVGGGGGGAVGIYNKAGGMAGEVKTADISINPAGQNISVTVGSGGGVVDINFGNNGQYAGSAGGSSSFGGLVTALGGAGGSSSSTGSPYAGNSATRTTCGGTANDGARAGISGSYAYGGQSSGFGVGGYGRRTEDYIRSGSGILGGGGGASRYRAGYGGAGAVKVSWGD